MLVLQISEQPWQLGARVFDPKCKEWVAHLAQGEAPTPSPWSPQTIRTFHPDKVLIAKGVRGAACQRLCPSTCSSYRAAAAWAPAWHPSCPSSAGARSRRWSASAPAAPRRGSTPSLRLPSTAHRVNHRLILSPTMPPPLSSPRQAARPRKPSHRAAPPRPPIAQGHKSTGSQGDYGFEAIQPASAEPWQINDLVAANRIK